MLLEQPVAYDIDLSVNKNFIFLTGANMARQEYLYQSRGCDVYLAHRYGCTSQRNAVEFFDGLLSNIQVVDNIIKGESFFFNEAQRIKSTIEK